MKEAKKGQNISKPKLIPINDICRRVKTGGQHSYAIGQKCIYLWGKIHPGIPSVHIQRLDNDKQCYGSIVKIPLQVDKIATGNNHTFAWKDNKVYCWGSNQLYQLGLEEQISYECTKVELFEQASQQGYHLKEISCGDHHTLAIFTCNNEISNKIVEENGLDEFQEIKQIEDNETDIKLFGWGQSASYQLTINSTSIIPYPVLSSCSFKSIDSINSKGDYNVVICDGKVYSWGCNLFSRLGLVSHESQSSLLSTQFPKIRLPRLVRLPQKISKVATGSYHVVAVSESGCAYSWGRGSHGQLGSGKFQSQSKPSKMVCNYLIENSSCGDYHTLVLLKDGRLMSCGGNSSEVLGHKQYDKSDKKKRCKQLEFVENCENIGEIISIDSGTNHNIIANKKGQVFGWGNNDYFQVMPQHKMDSKPNNFHKKSLQIVLDQEEIPSKVQRIYSENEKSMLRMNRLSEWKIRFDRFKKRVQQEQHQLLGQLQQILADMKHNE